MGRVVLPNVARNLQAIGAVRAEELNIEGSAGPIPTFVATPATEQTCPGVLVVHDALGMTEDLRNQTRWLASAGYLAAAPDLFHRGARTRCLFRTMSELAKGTQGESFDDLRAVRSWLRAHDGCNGKVAILGFCLGGGFALALAPSGDYDACSANYGAVAKEGWPQLEAACPIVASYGRDDASLRGEAAKMQAALRRFGVPHDVKEYPGVGHGFMNDHPPEDGNWVFSLLSWVSNTRYDASATQDARARIIDFFDAHLKAAG